MYATRIHTPTGLKSFVRLIKVKKKPLKRAYKSFTESMTYEVVEECNVGSRDLPISLALSDVRSNNSSLKINPYENIAVRSTSIQDTILHNLAMTHEGELPKMGQQIHT